MILVGALFLALLIAEVAFRINGKYAVYSEKFGQGYSSIFTPGERNWYHVYFPKEDRRDYGEEFSYHFIANNEGLLEKEFSTDKDSNTVRVMVFGDSFIQGIGAPYDSSCPRQLEGILRREVLGKKVEVWDCGIGGSDPYFEYILLQKLMKYHPDYVIVGLNSTDISDLYLRGGMERFKPDSTVQYRPRPWFEPLYGKSFVVRRVVHDVLHYNWLLQKPSEQEHDRIASILKINAVLDSFQRTCASKHIPLLVSLQPCLFEFIDGIPYSMTAVKTHCDSANIPAIDLKAYMANIGYAGDKVKPIYWPIDGHFNNAGYGIYAKFLGETVAKDLNADK